MLRPGDDHAAPAVLADIIQRILSVSDPEQIILFGSHARGEAGPDSDVDLLVVMDVESPRRESVRLRRALRGLRIPVDVIVATPQQLQRYRNAIGMIFAPALRDGKVVYAHAPTPRNT